MRQFESSNISSSKFENARMYQQLSNSKRSHCQTLQRTELERILSNSISELLCVPDLQNQKTEKIVKFGVRRSFEIASSQSLKTFELESLIRVPFQGSRDLWLIAADLFSNPRFQGRLFLCRSCRCCCGDAPQTRPVLTRPSQNAIRRCASCGCT